MRWRGTMMGLLLAVLLGTGAARADQNDPRLDRLFARLDAAESVREAQRIERRIWRIWHDHEDEKVQSVMSRGQFYLGRGDRESALDAFDQAVRLAPDFAEAWNARATLYYLLGNYRRSLADIRKVLKLEPRHFGALAGRGLCWLALDRPRKALDAFKASLAVHPHQPGTQARAEQLRDRLGERDI